jgi:hypothetical protein
VETTTLVQVADHLGAGKATVSYWFDRHGLRPFGFAGRVERHIAAAFHRQGHKMAATDPVS